MQWDHPAQPKLPALTTPPVKGKQGDEVKGPRQGVPRKELPAEVHELRRHGDSGRSPAALSREGTHHGWVFASVTMLLWTRLAKTPPGSTVKRGSGGPATRHVGHARFAHAGRPC